MGCRSILRLGVCRCRCTHTYGALRSMTIICPSSLTLRVVSHIYAHSFSRLLLVLRESSRLAAPRRFITVHSSPHVAPTLWLHDVQALQPHVGPTRPRDVRAPPHVGPPRPHVGPTRPHNVRTLLPTSIETVHLTILSNFTVRPKMDCPS